MPLHKMSFSLSFLMRLLPLPVFFSAVIADSAALFDQSPQLTSLSSQVSCIKGTFPITVDANLSRFSLAEPKSQPEVNQILVDLLGVDTVNYTNSVTRGSGIVHGTYRIYGEFCAPYDQASKSFKPLQTLQILSHGDTLTRLYWNSLPYPGQSYVDFMTSRGYGTLAYDRLGMGLSEHPDAINVVQYPIHVEILHTILQTIRGATQSKKFSDVPTIKNFISVGHSAGSTVTSALTAKYPGDFDAVSLTGISAVQTFIGLTDAALLLSIGAVDERTKAPLSNGYLTPLATQGEQFAFFHYPGYDQKVFDTVFATRQTNTIGELLTYNNIVLVSPTYNKPVDVVLGQYDNIFCGDDCYAGTPPPVGGNQAAAFIPAYYPKADASKSKNFIVSGSGHVINAHKTAPDSWAHQLSFFKGCGL